MDTLHRNDPLKKDRLGCYLNDSDDFYAETCDGNSIFIFQKSTQLVRDLLDRST